MKLYNTLSRSLQEFEPLSPPKVTMYVCGPTVYDHPHIGHARSAFTFDLLHRYLQFKGFKVTFVRNVTDVDDKIIQKAREEGGQADLNAKCREVAEKYLKSYHDALEQMGVGRPDREPKATEHVVPDPRNVELTGKIDASMTGYISRLLTQGVAYPAGGDVYFSVRKAAGYGGLSNRSIEELQSGARVEPGEQKQDPLDFALWKGAKPGEPSWPSPWGPGRPGWHIECTVMSTTYLGDAFDIHGGGVDLVFPHHENELAQARGLGKPFAKYWVHNGLLTVNNEKMSKSLKNFVTLDDAFAASQGKADVLKMFFLGAHYRSPIDYTKASISASGERYGRLTQLMHRAEQWRSAGKAVPVPDEVRKLEARFSASMDDDLNTPAALACLDELANYGHKITDASLKAQLVHVADAIRTLGSVLGLKWEEKAAEMTADQQELVKAREYARKAKDFATADKIRKQLELMGLVVEDTAEGSFVRKK